MRQGPQHIRVVPKDQYITAVQRLEQLQLGYSVISEIGGVSFIKRLPADVSDILREHKELDTTIDNYGYRFNKPLTKSLQINVKLRQMLIAVGYAGLLQQRTKKPSTR